VVGEEVVDVGEGCVVELDGGDDGVEVVV